jgi:SAM-dependent methyltransferase
MASNKFFDQKITEILHPGNLVIDIGGGLRALPGRGNRYDESKAWLQPFLAQVDYKILDPVPDYQPDIVGDIHELPLADGSVDAIICIAVLEHVRNPFQAVAEMKRVLKPGGRAFVYVPFLFYFHSEVGYYSDYWRFTKEGVEELFKDFSTIEFGQSDGALVTWIRLTPLGHYRLVRQMFAVMDRVLKKDKSRNTSGHGFMVTN